MKNIEVVAAVIKYDNKFLCCQRGPKGEVGLKWEFPGGKIEQGETKEEALLRELKEELDMQVKVDSFLTTVEYQYNTFHLTMHAFLCIAIDGNFTLKEHVDAKWLDLKDLSSLDWAAADVPVLKEIY